MIASVELAEPGDLWARWAAFAAAWAGIGYDDVWSVGPGGAHLDDGSGNWAHLALVAGGRAVLYGYDHEYSSTVSADPPLDLLDGAPDWLPWTDLVRHQAEDELGYVLWYTGGRWSRVAYPDGVQDGLTATARPVLERPAAVRELEDLVWGWAEHAEDTPQERASVAAAAEALLARAEAATLDAEAVAALIGRLTDTDVDVPAAVAVAGRAGITRGGVPPAVPAGTRPARRRVRRLSDEAHDRLIWTAMHATAELERPVPVPTGELGALVSWLRAHARNGDGRTSLLFYADDTSISAQRGEHPPAEDPAERGLASFRQLGELVRRLRGAEADPVRGRWLFLRVETTADTVTVQRRYDSWPSWWADNGISGPWRSNLRSEMDRRAEAWQPSWVELLDPEVAYRPA